MGSRSALHVGPFLVTGCPGRSRGDWPLGHRRSWRVAEGAEEALPRRDEAPPGGRGGLPHRRGIPAIRVTPFGAFGIVASGDPHPRAADTPDSKGCRYQVLGVAVDRRSGSKEVVR